MKRLCEEIATVSETDLIIRCTVPEVIHDLKDR